MKKQNCFSFVLKSVSTYIMLCTISFFALPDTSFCDIVLLVIGLIYLVIVEALYYYKVVKK